LPLVIDPLGNQPLNQMHISKGNTCNIRMELIAPLDQAKETFDIPTADSAGPLAQ
jgi:hypothetical protein